MYCPNCGQQQISDEMRFCSRCGQALSGLAEWLAGGRLPVTNYRPFATDGRLTGSREDESENAALSPRRKGIRRAAKLMFFSGVLFPIFLGISIAIEEGPPMIIPFGVFFVSLVMMLYARLFSDNTAPAPRMMYQAPQTSVLDPTPARNSLTPPTNIPIPGAERRRVRTNELVQPPSVTDHTTRLLDNE